jgi:hypothetical protein
MPKIFVSANKPPLCSRDMPTQYVFIIKPKEEEEEEE